MICVQGSLIEIEAIEIKTQTGKCAEFLLALSFVFAMFSFCPNGHFLKQITLRWSVWNEVQFDQKLWEDLKSSGVSSIMDQIKYILFM